MAKQLKRIDVEIFNSSNMWTLWASPDDVVTVGLMAGVLQIGQSSIKGRYDLHVDKRYDLEELKAEILALNDQEEINDDLGL